MYNLALEHQIHFCDREASRLLPVANLYLAPRLQFHVELSQYKLIFWLIVGTNIFDSIDVDVRWNA